VVYEAGAQGLQAHPKSFDLSKIRAKFLKIPGKSRENIGKVYENVRKYPENLGKRPEHIGKHHAQRCLISKNGAQHLQNHVKTFFGGRPEEKPS